MPALQRPLTPGEAARDTWWREFIRLGTATTWRAADMAGAHLKGLAEIEHQLLVGSPNRASARRAAARLLAAGFSATVRRRLWTAWSADETVRETFVLGEAVDEIVGVVRFENQPDLLRALIRAGIEDDAAMIYRPYGPSGTAFPWQLSINWRSWVILCSRRTCPGAASRNGRRRCACVVSTAAPGVSC